MIRRPTDVARTVTLFPCTALYRSHRPDVGLGSVTAGGVAAVGVEGDGQEVILQVRMLDAGAAADEAAVLEVAGGAEAGAEEKPVDADQRLVPRDRKSTRLNSSH